MTGTDFDRINGATGFANGDTFDSAEQVRTYFTPAAQRDMFGADAVADPDLLAEWAATVIANRWHMKPETATNPVVYLDEIYDEMRKCFRAALTSGRNWHAVTVGADGTPYCREEVNRCVSESEYFGKGDPYPVTVWSMNGDASVSADAIDSEAEQFDPADQFAGYGGVPELVRKLETAGFTVIE